MDDEDESSLTKSNDTNLTSKIIEETVCCGSTINKIVSKNHIINAICLNYEEIIRENNNTNKDFIIKDTFYLTNIPDIGGIIAKSIVEYFSNEENKKIIDDLKKEGINTEYLGKKIEVDENFSNKSFVLTGTLTLYTRDEAKEIIESKGGKTVDSVSKKTSVVIVGDKPGSKYTKAQELGIEIWTEEEFKNKLS